MVIFGIVEDRKDPLRLGRCRVRIVGKHNPDRSILRTEDLPWAYPVQGLTSAAMSGIGSTPIGPVEGTTVKIEFYDEEEQIPIMTGTVGGIPQDSTIIDRDSTSLEVRTETTEVVEIPFNAKPAKSYNSISQDGVDLIKEKESLRLTAYLDSAGVPTIGYGTTLINGQPVTLGMTITEDQAEEYFTDHLNQEVIKYVKSNVKTVVTQSMFDSLCSFVYNLGSGNFAKSTLLAHLNSSQYLECAAAFDLYNKDKAGNTLAGLVKRRAEEKALFLKDGVPGATGAVKKLEVEDVQRQNESVLYGFKDPTGKYPLYFNEPDTNRLARHEQIEQTIVVKKEAARVKGVVSAGGFSWTQSAVPYNALYPFNHVRQSESGHVLEFDDTPGSERVHLYHRSGTFFEVDANGTEVKRIVGDGYEILERDGFLYIKGDRSVTIDGVSRVKVNNALNLDVVGATTINVFNDVNLNVAGDMNTSVAGEYRLKASSLKIETDGSMDFKAGDKMAMDYVRGDFGNGAASSGLSNNLQTQTPVTRDKPGLSVITRGLVSAQDYETPEEGDPTEFINSRIDKGLIDPEELDSGEPQMSEEVKPNNMVPINGDCSIINQMEKFTPSFQLSRKFTLGELTKGGTRMPVNQFNLTPQEIVCNLKGLCENCLDPIFDMYPNASITSGFRRPGDVKNSAKTSQHYFGQAADIVLRGFNREQHYEAINKIQQSIPHDQLLLEYSGSDTVWIHVSFNYAVNRKMVFTMRDHRKISNTGEFILIA